MNNFHIIQKFRQLLMRIIKMRSIISKTNKRRCSFETGADKYKQNVCFSAEIQSNRGLKQDPNMSSILNANKTCPFDVQQNRLFGSSVARIAAPNQSGRLLVVLVTTKNRTKIKTIFKRYKKMHNRIQKYYYIRVRSNQNRKRAQTASAKTLAPKKREIGSTQ